MNAHSCSPPAGFGEPELHGQFSADGRVLETGHHPGRDTPEKPLPEVPAAPLFIDWTTKNVDYFFENRGRPESKRLPIAIHTCVLPPG